jgi:hypothetical protein
MSSETARYTSLILPPGAWLMTTQLGQMLPYVDCLEKTHWTAFTAFAAVFLAAGGGLLGWKSYSAAASRTARFVSGFGIFFGCAIGFALLLQGAASLLLNECER